MDDVTLRGCQETVARDVQTVTDVGRDMGLNMNVSKCEVNAHPGCQNVGWLDVLYTRTLGPLAIRHFDFSYFFLFNPRDLNYLGY